MLLYGGHLFFDAAIPTIAATMTPMTPTIPATTPGVSLDGGDADAEIVTVSVVNEPLPVCAGALGAGGAGAVIVTSDVVKEPG